MNTNIDGLSKDVLQTEALAWAPKAKALRIIDAESCINASHFLRSIKGVRSDIASWFAPHVEAAMETKRKAEAARKALVDEKDRMEAPLIAAEQTVKRALLDWESAQERVRREQERQLQERARAEAEAQTIEAAAALEREAVATDNAGMLQEAQELLAQPIDTPVVVVQSSMPKVQGVSYRDNWKAHPDVNVRELARAVAEGTAPESFLTANMTGLNAFARATQGLQPVAGVKFWNDRQIAARG